MTSYESDTWSFDGSSWIALAGTGPGPRSGPVLVFDVGRRVMLMFGGWSDRLTGRDDTWEFDGTGWTQRQVKGPSARSGHAMAYDVARGRTVLFGGSSVGVLGDTWLFDGVAWTQATAGSAPTARTGHAMVFDEWRRRVVLFGGNTTPFSSLGDTWEWDGSRWSQIAVAGGPMPRAYHAMTYDRSRQRVVLHGGFAFSSAGIPVLFTDTWEWDGVAWLQRQPVGVPTARFEHEIAFHEATGKTILFGGFDSSGNTTISETWQYGPQFPATLSLFGTACAGTVFPPQLGGTPSQFPWLGDTIDLRLRLLPATPGSGLLYVGFSNSQWGAVPLPLALTPIGMTGCDLLVSPDVGLPFQHTGGAANVPLAIPNGAVFIGLPFYDQAVLLDPGANPLGVTSTNGLAGRIGAR